MICTAKRVFLAKDVPFVVSTISDYIWGSVPQKTSPKWTGIGISQPNQQSNNIAIYRSLMKILASDFTDRLTTGNIIEEKQD